MRSLVSLLVIFAIGCSCATTQIVPNESVEPEKDIALKAHGSQISGAITNGQYVNFINQLVEVDASEPFALIVIHSEGGQMDPGYRISKAIEQMSIPTVCLVDVYAYSMAVYILQSCDYRLITTRGSLMVHNPSLPTSEDLSTVELVNNAAFIRIAKNTYFNYVISKTNGKLLKEDVEFRTQDGLEWYFTAEEALGFGLVDGVVKDIDEAEEAATYKYTGKLP